MSTSFRCLALVICLNLPMTAGASCRDESALKAAEASGYQSDRLPLIACRELPDNRRQIAVAFIKGIELHTFTMTVLVVSKDSGQTQGVFVDEDPSFGPNGYPVAIEIDTGRYGLAARSRAFGVRVTHSLNSWDSTQDLSLFVLQKNALRRVLQNLTVASSSMRSCELESHQMTRTLSVAQSGSNGLRDLLVHTRHMQIEPSYGNDHQCRSIESNTSETVRLQYNGASYARPEGFY